MIWLVLLCITIVISSIIGVAFYFYEQSKKKTLKKSRKIYKKYPDYKRYCTICGELAIVSKEKKFDGITGKVNKVVYSYKMCYHDYGKYCGYEDFEINVNNK